MAAVLGAAAALGACSAAGAPAAGSRPGPGDASIAEAARRADTALDALVTGYWDGWQFTTTRGGGQGAAYWLSAQALDAVLDGAARTGGRWADVARSFIASQDARGWRSDYLDDENWMALALLRAADVLGDDALVARAAALLDDIVATGTDSSCCGARPGGLWWDRFHTQKATASNAGPVITAARLFEKTGDASRLDFARRVFAWWLANMVDPSTGQVADHLGTDGSKVWWRFTYNEGAMIGAALALHRVTGEATYLETAQRIGAFVLSRETVPTAFGRVLSDGAACDGDCEQFKGIAQRYLAALADADPRGGWEGLVAADAEAVWNLARDPATTTFGVDWTCASSTPSIASQSSAAMALALDARPPAR